MLKYIGRRLLLMIPVVLGVTVIVFSIMYIIPGDPAVAILGSEATEEALNALREKLNLNDPYLIRLGKYMYQVFIQHDLGDSYLTGKPILNDLIERFPNTLILDIWCIIVQLFIGVPLGIYAATHHNKLGDYGTMTFSLLGVSIPGFWLSLMMVLVFANILGWLPPYGLDEGWRSWVLPIVSTSIFGIGQQGRLARSSMLEVLNSDYVVMARSKGLSERQVVFNHALPNALIPVITVAGTAFGGLFGGGMLVETIFSIPGIGYYMVKAVNSRDFPAVQGSILLLSIAFSIVILLTDLIMAMVDPRIKSQFISGKKKKKKTAEKEGA
jgi:peptide/nickel transport system permease protein